MKKICMRMLALALLLALLPCVNATASAAAKLGLGFLYEGSSVTLGPKLRGVPVEQLDWRSSNESVAAVSQGRIEGRAAGKAIVAASRNGASAYCGVVVIPREVRLRVGEVVSLPCAGQERYFVEHQAVAAVNRRGQILGKRAGTTRLGIACGKQRMIVQVSVVGAEAAQQSAAASLDCADQADQIVLVEYQGGSKARLSIHEKQAGIWRELYSCTAYVGRNGIDKTREGDGRTPTGTFNLTKPFGIKADPGSNMGYVQVTKYHYWCGTSGSGYYNQMVDERVTDRRHGSSDEYLIEYKGVYNYCMFIDYNAAGEAGKGSCIFLHCKGSKSSTAGCIAVDESVMKKIIRWARPGCKIVIR